MGVNKVLKSPEEVLNEKINKILKELETIKSGNQATKIFPGGLNTIYIELANNSIEYQWLQLLSLDILLDASERKKMMAFLEFSIYKDDVNVPANKYPLGANWTPTELNGFSFDNRYDDFAVTDVDPTCLNPFIIHQWTFKNNGAGDLVLYIPVRWRTPNPNVLGG